MRIETPIDLLLAAADGDIVASLQTLSLGVAAAFAVVAARRLVEDEPSPSPPPPPPTVDDKVALDIDLGDNGEPPGLTRLLLKPTLPRSDLVVLQLRVPLGLLIEERNGTIVVTGALPGYSAISQVEAGDVVRAVTLYAEVVAGAPMWQQVTSGTPVGSRSLKRLLFRTDGGTFADVRGAIASHRTSEGGNGAVTLVVEREVEPSVPLAPRDARPPRLEPLRDVLARDLRLPGASAMGEDELGELSLGARARRLLDDRDGGA